MDPLPSSDFFFVRALGLVAGVLASEPYPSADTVAAPVSVIVRGTGGTATLNWPAGCRGDGAVIRPSESRFRLKAGPTRDRPRASR